MRVIAALLFLFILMSAFYMAYYFSYYTYDTIKTEIFKITAIDGTWNLTRTNFIDRMETLLYYIPSIFIGLCFIIGLALIFTYQPEGEYYQY